MVSEQRLAQTLPDRTDSELPPQVQWFLSVIETAVASDSWNRRHEAEPVCSFVVGVFDYWWDSEVEKPSWGDIFILELDGSPRYEDYIPRYEQFCYQQGAIVGWHLSEKFDEGERLK